MRKIVILAVLGFSVLQAQRNPIITNVQFPIPGVSDASLCVGGTIICSVNYGTDIVKELKKYDIDLPFPIHDPEYVQDRNAYQDIEVRFLTLKCGDHIELSVNQILDGMDTAEFRPLTLHEFSCMLRPLKAYAHLNDDTQNLFDIFDLGMYTDTLKNELIWYTIGFPYGKPGFGEFIDNQKKFRNNDRFLAVKVRTGV